MWWLWFVIDSDVFNGDDEEIEDEVDDDDDDEEDDEDEDDDDDEDSDKHDIDEVPNGWHINGLYWIGLHKGRIFSVHS